MEQRRERADAALFGAAAEDPIDIVEAQQRLFRRIGVGGLRIVDVEDFAAVADLLHPVREAGEGLQTLLDKLKLETVCAERRHRRRGVLAVVGAAQRGNAGEIGDGDRGALLAHEPHAFEHDAVRNGRMMDRDRHDGSALRAQLLRNAGANLVIDSDDRDIGLGDEPFLDLGIMFHRPVPIEMIDRDVQENAEGRIERRREIDLER